MKFIYFLLILIYAFILTPESILAFDNQNDTEKILGVTDVKNPTAINVVTSSGIVNLYFFYSLTCPHCHAEALFLSKLKTELGDKLKIYSFELSKNAGNVELYQKFGQVFKIDLTQIQVPGTFIGEKSFIGYGSDEYDGANIRNFVEQCLKLDCQDLGASIINRKNKNESENKSKALPVIIGAVIIIVAAVIILIYKNSKFKITNSK